MSETQMKTSLMDWFDERINPMAVRYFRQAVQNRTLTVMVLLLLALQVGVALIMTMQDSSLHAGQYMFTGIAVCWGIMACLVVPSYMSQRVAADRGDKLDLTNITTMSPFRYVNGIFFVGLVILLLMSSVCFPFMVFCYILRGIGLVEIFTSIYGIMSASLLMLMLGIMCGTFPNKKGKSSGAVMVVLLLLFGITILGRVAAVIFGGSHISLIMVATSGFVGMILLLVLFYLIAVFKVSPEMSNRMLPLRIYVTVMIAAYLGISFFAVGFNAKALLDGCMISAWVIIISMLVAVSEQDVISLRVRAQIPRRNLLKFIAWFFYSGSAAGICWCVAAYAATLLALHVGAKYMMPFSTSYISMDYSDINNAFYTYLATGLYAYCFLITAVFVRKAVLRDIVSASRTIVVVAVLLLLVHVVTHTFAVMLRPDEYVEGLWSVFEGKSLPFWMAFDPVVYAIADDGHSFARMAVPVLAIWAGAVTLIMVPWFKYQFESFSPINREEIMVLEK